MHFNKHLHKVSRINSVRLYLFNFISFVLLWQVLRKFSNCEFKNKILNIRAAYENGVSYNRLPRTDV